MRYSGPIAAQDQLSASHGGRPALPPCAVHQVRIVSEIDIRADSTVKQEEQGSGTANGTEGQGAPAPVHAVAVLRADGRLWLEPHMAAETPDDRAVLAAWHARPYQFAQHLPPDMAASAAFSQGAKHEMTLPGRTASAILLLNAGHVGLYPAIGLGGRPAFLVRAQGSGHGGRAAAAREAHRIPPLPTPPRLRRNGCTRTRAGRRRASHAARARSRARLVTWALSTCWSQTGSGSWS